MTYQPAKDIWEVNEILDYDEALPVEDPRYVATEEGRGNFSFRALLRTFGVNEREMRLERPTPRRYLVFCGHRGCGKSTELTRLARKLNGPQLFLVVFLDATRDLDFHNLQYPDVLMGLAKALFEKLEKCGISIDQVFLTRLEKWFSERIEKHEEIKIFASEIKAGAKGQIGIPLVGKLFAAITNSFKSNSTYKDELRTVIKNSFKEFADAFNLLIGAVEEVLQSSQQGRKLLFVVDGTDRLRDDDRQRFFINDAYQLQAIEANFIYCCPIELLHEGNQVQPIFKHVVLPMIKLEEKGKPHEAGYRVMRQMALRRADKCLFQNEETLDRAIEYSGGNPRELLRILQTAFTHADDDLFDEKAIDRAIGDLAVDFKRFLEPEDYRILAAVDLGMERNWDSQRENFLLYNLALMEYNSFYRRSHPVIRGLDEYKKSSKELEKRRAT